MKKCLKLIFIIIAVFFIASSSFFITANADESLPLEGRVIVLDPGHGDYGNSYLDYEEGTQMFKLALLIRSDLESLGATVYMTREDSTDVSLTDRVTFTNTVALNLVKDGKVAEIAATTDAEEIAILQAELDEVNDYIAIMESITEDNDLMTTYYRVPYDYSNTESVNEDLERIFELEDCDEVASRMLFISLHSNAISVQYESVSGVSAYYLSNEFAENTTYYSGYDYVENSLAFCNLIISAIGEVGFKELDAEENNFYVIREANVPSVLVENGFHTNTSDREMLLDDAVLAEMADAYCDAIIAYYESDFIPEIPVYEAEVVDVFLDIETDAVETDAVETEENSSVSVGVVILIILLVLIVILGILIFIDRRRRLKARKIRMERFM